MNEYIVIVKITYTQKVYYSVKSDKPIKTVEECEGYEIFDEDPIEENKREIVNCSLYEENSNES